MKLPKWLKIPKFLMSLNEINAICDNCNYQEKIDIKNITESEINNLLGKKCPHCGHEMLNENDIKVFRRMINTLSITEKESQFEISYRTKKH